MVLKDLEPCTSIDTERFVIDVTSFKKIARKHLTTNSDKTRLGYEKMEHNITIEN